MEKQFEGFAAALDKQTETQINEIMENAQRLRDEILSNAQMTVQQESEKTNEESAARTEEYNRRRISKTALDAKRAVLTRREEMHEQICSKVREKLKLFCGTKDYERRMAEEIDKTGGISGADIYVSPSDMRLKELFAGRGARSVNPDPKISCGGFYIIYPETGMIDDRTYDLRLRILTRN